MDYIAFLLHLLGDYVTQNNWMANNKTSRFFPAFVHGTVYIIPFWFFVDPTFGALLVMWWTHILIDHYRLARYVIFAKEWISNPKLKWIDCDKTGYPNDSPPWLTVWLMIAADNFMHLTINYLSLKYL